MQVSPTWQGLVAQKLSSVKLKKNIVHVKYFDILKKWIILRIKVQMKLRSLKKMKNVLKTAVHTDLKLTFLLHFSSFFCKKRTLVNHQDQY